MFLLYLKVLEHDVSLLFLLPIPVVQHLTGVIIKGIHYSKYDHKKKKYKSYVIANYFEPPHWKTNNRLV